MKSNYLLELQEEDNLSNIESLLRGLVFFKLLHYSLLVEKAKKEKAKSGGKKIENKGNSQIIEKKRKPRRIVMDK